MEQAIEIMEVPGAEALAALAQWRDKGRKEGRGVPVLLGAPEVAERVLEIMSEVEQSTADLLAMAAAIDPLDWLRQREEDYAEDYADEGGDIEQGIHGEWPEEGGGNSLMTTLLDLETWEPLEQVVIALIPCEQAWQLPCYLKTGGWNEYPFAPEQSALFRHWQEKYGARIVAITDDVIECEVENPATTREEALALARQQFLFCTDIVFQGCETLEVLAATLLNGRVWYFWWD